MINGNVDVHYVNPRDNNTALMYAVKERDWDVVELLARIAHLPMHGRRRPNEVCALQLKKVREKMEDEWNELIMGVTLQLMDSLHLDDNQECKNDDDATNNNSGGGDEVSESTANRITELPQQSRPQRPQQQQQQQQQLKNVLALQSACARVLKQTRQLDSILQQRQQRAEDIFVLDDDDNKNEAG